MPSYHFSKGRLPRGMSYSLKRSLLDAALDHAGIDSLANVYYSLAQRGAGPTISAEYTTETARGWAGAGFVSLFVHAVPSPSLKEVRRAVESLVLPRLVAWLRDLQVAGNASRGMAHGFRATWTGAGFSVQQT